MTVPMKSHHFSHGKPKRGLFTLHLTRNSLIPINMSLTKYEVDRLVEGYPPFYRSTVTTTGAVKLTHPITKASHIGRGSWVLAVGMTTMNGHICSVHNMQRIVKRKAEAEWKGTLVMNAFKMIGRALNQLKDYEGTQGPHNRAGPAGGLWSTAAISCFEMILSAEYSYYPWSLKQQEIERSPLFESIVGQYPCSSSCLGEAFHSASCRRGQHARKDPASYLTEAQCEAAFEIFNHNTHFTPNLEIIWPVLPEILQTLILGVSEVQQYFQHVGRKLEIPQNLSEQKYIYLRQCDEGIK
ncbi:hypothetical protein BKA65DRAFT_144572 [Rhexocercosporidium sp. MPI-PUGE-AT-0058]|nr:hypothetical protein BKA65DRAFT_144572 [Rhexocercosporidium sp. MPI-PUGE-AT-0058]